MANKHEKISNLTVIAKMEPKTMRYFFNFHIYKYLEDWYACYNVHKCMGKHSLPSVCKDFNN